MTTKIQRCRTKVNNAFFDHLHAAFKKKFNGCEIRTYYRLFAGDHVTERVDGAPLFIDERTFIETYSEAYAAAMVQIDE